MATTCPKCSAICDLPSQSWCTQCGAKLLETERGIVSSDPSISSVVHRYRDSYHVASSVVGFGAAIKAIGGVMAALIFLGSFGFADGPLGGVSVLVGIVVAISVGLLFWVCGVVVAAQGQALQAILDSAVASSPFLTNQERATAMGLPQKT